MLLLPLYLLLYIIYLLLQHTIILLFYYYHLLLLLPSSLLYFDVVCGWLFYDFAKKAQFTQLPNQEERDLKFDCRRSRYKIEMSSFVDSDNEYIQMTIRALTELRKKLNLTPKMTSFQAIWNRRSGTLRNK